MAQTIRDDREFIGRHAERVVLHATRAVVTLRNGDKSVSHRETANDSIAPAKTVELPYTPRQLRTATTFDGDRATRASRPDPAPIQALVRAHACVRALANREFDTIEDLAADVGLHPKVVRSTVKLAWRAPDITGAILQGRQPWQSIILI